MLTEGLKWRMLQCRMAGVEIRRRRSTELVGEVVAGRLRASDPHERVLRRYAKPGRWSVRLGGTGGEEIPRRSGGWGGEDEVARGKDGGAPVSGLAGSSSKAAGAWRRRSSGGARGRRRSRRRGWETTAARRRLGMPKFGGRRRLRDIYRAPPFVPGEATTRDKRP